jgi:hypothetical protein
MKKNLYYRTMFRRHNAIKEFFLSFFYAICSIPRLLLEVFIRKNLGERYFSFSTAMVTAFILLSIPLTIGAVPSLYNRYSGAEFDILTFLKRYLTWYLCLAGFVAKCFDRRHELKRLPSVFDFARFSLSAGTIHPSFYQFRFKGRSFNIREIETMLEPGFFFVIGFVLMLIAQPVGFLIMLCAICYSISYVATYHNGDNFIMDKIDEMILNEEYVNSFVDGMDPEDTRGVRYYGRTPADPEVRRQMVDSIIVDTDFVEAR